MIIFPFLLGFLEKYNFLVLNKTKEFQLQITAITMCIDFYCDRRNVDFYKINRKENLLSI